MTQPSQSLNAALRGAVDLSALSRPRPTAPGQPGAAAPAGSGAPGGSAAGGPGAQAGAGAAAAGDDGVLVQATDATFNALVTGSTTVPAVLVLVTDQVPESVDFVQTLVDEAIANEGRFRVAAVDIATNPGIVQALSPVLQEAFGQVSALPVVVGLLQGQPVPFFLGVQPIEQVRQIVEQFLSAAVTNGITGRVDLAQAPAAGEGEEEAELPPLHQEALEAIDKGDLDAAVAAYEQALKDNPKDEDARLGLGQVDLMRRTTDLDPASVRAAAAADPSDVDAQLNASDLDLVGGHVEDAFLRLIELVRRSAGDDRDRVRKHLLGQFDVVGSTDPRVTKARQSLMSALF
ncbi:tetratricopeptide repeat protein [Ornithinimicrobium cryptoxanthini]|uniref:Tetratricopeptide repeat protein n=1 Tax=Ornithinimicrobium cryptoxanthini TaxID=2934161 RepID=A0ABY4YGZ3_9MICO|nr:tetratricopeptide repeat protein [Ornithinimicrobium cryptoxanthini]USQ75618.1 tetratricopeptide repeat protein [Ornithinimicrobium cryptoxanthini]